MPHRSHKVHQHVWDLITTEQIWPQHQPMDVYIYTCACGETLTRVPFPPYIGSMAEGTLAEVAQDNT